MSEILSVTGAETSPAASCNGHCLVTRDFTPLDAGGGEEHKYFAPGIGQVLTIDIDTGDREELIEYQLAP